MTPAETQKWLETYKKRAADVMHLQEVHELELSFPISKAHPKAQVLAMRKKSFADYQRANANLTKLADRLRAHGLQIS